MKKFNEYSTSISFFLKSRSKKKDIKTKSVYATIAYRGTSTKLSTGLICEDPEKNWKAGAFVGRNFQDLNDKLAELRREIKSINPASCKNAEEVKRTYLGEEEEKFSMTVLNALEFGYNQKKYEVKPSTLYNHRMAIHKLEKYLYNQRYRDWSILRDHPNRMTKLKVIEYYNWMLDNGARESANTQIGCIAALYKQYYDIHEDQNADLVPNLFSRMQKQGNKQDRIEAAMSRSIDWKYVEEIDKVRNKITNCVLDKRGPLGYKEIDENSYWKYKTNNESFAERKERYRIYGLLTMFIANTGMAFIEFGKPDVFEITHTMSLKGNKYVKGEQLSGRRVKQGMKYRIPISPTVKKLIKELKGNLPWEPYVDKLRQYNPAVRATAYWPYKQYLIILSEVLGYEDGIRGHKLRHSFAMRMLNHYGLSIQTVAEMLGDTIKTTSENYASYLDQTVQENYNEEIARHQEKLEKLEGKNKDKKKKKKG